MTLASDITLFIDPVTHHFQRDVLFDTRNARLNGDNILAPYASLREWFGQRGIAVHTADRLVRGEKGSARNVYVSMGIQEHYRALARRPDVTLSAFFALECPIVEPSLYWGLADVQSAFRRVFTFSSADALAPFLQRPLRSHKFFIPQSFEAIHEEIWKQEQRRFLVMINANKLPRVYWRELYTERLRAVEYFSRTGEIDLYGVGWDRPQRRVGKTWVPATFRLWAETMTYYWHKVWPNPLLEAARRAYRGRADSKAATLGKYTFALCFENMILEGWITEKIFDCFFAGTIPVYWGAPDITDHIPADCFIDMRRFSGYEELRRYLHSLTTADIRGYKERARAYLQSPAFDRFTKAAFTALFAGLIEEDLGVKL